MQRRKRICAHFLVLLVCLAADLFFLRGALFDDAVRAPSADIAHAMPYGREKTERPQPCTNPYLTDWSYSIHSWQKLVRDSYLSGHLPLWNDRAGCGQPLIGNLQAEVFSPYQPINIVAGDQYIDWKQLAQMIVAQLSCIILIWVLGLSPWAALITAVGFSFGSYMQGFAIHPVAGSAAFAPAILAAFIGLRRRFQPVTVFLGALVIAASICAGHIESTFMACFAACAVAFLGGEKRDKGLGAKRRLLFIPQALFVGIVGLGLAACQLFPFLDYLDQSLVTMVRAMAPKRVIPSIQMFTLFDAKAFGFPTEGRGFYGEGNYMETIVHVGRVVLALSLIGVIAGFLRKQKLVIPMFVLSALGIAIAFAPGAWHEGLAFFPFSVMPLLRMHFLGSILLPVLAGYGLDFLLDDLRHRHRRPLILTTIVATLLTLVCVGVTLIEGDKHGLGDAAYVQALDFSAPLLFIGMPVLVFLCARFSKNNAAALCAIVLASAAIIESQLLWQPFVPTSESAPLSPRSTVLSFVEEKPGRKRLLPSLWELPPELGNLHNLTSLRTYDGMGLARLSALLFHQRSYLGVPVHAPIFRVNPETLDMLSVGWTLTDYSPELTPFPFMEVFAEPGATREFPYVCRKGEQLEIIVCQPERQPLALGALEFSIAQGETPPLTWKLGDKSVRQSVGTIHSDMDFPIRSYEERLAEFQGSPHFYAAFRPDGTISEGTTVQGKLTVAKGSPRLLIRVVVRGGFGSTAVFEHKGLFVGRRESALPRAYVAASTRFCQPAEPSETAKTLAQRYMAQAIIESSLPMFDGHKVTSIESEKREDFLIARRDANIKAIGLHKVASGTFEMTVHENEDSVIVFSESFARGWRAEIDGAEATVLPANVCSMAIAVPEGKHTIRIFYWPKSLTWGIATSLLTFLAMLGFMVFSRLRGTKSPKQVNQV